MDLVFHLYQPSVCFIGRRFFRGKMDFSDTTVNKIE